VPGTCCSAAAVHPPGDQLKFAFVPPAILTFFVLVSPHHAFCSCTKELEVRKIDQLLDQQQPVFSNGRRDIRVRRYHTFLQVRFSIGACGYGLVLSHPKHCLKQPFRAKKLGATAQPQRPQEHHSPDDKRRVTRHSRFLGSSSNHTPLPSWQHCQASTPHSPPATQSHSVITGHMLQNYRLPKAACKLRHPQTHCSTLLVQNTSCRAVLCWQHPEKQLLLRQGRDVERVAQYSHMGRNCSVGSAVCASYDTQCPVRLVTQSNNHQTATTCMDINAASGL
jgi:hypothetical protein